MSCRTKDAKLLCLKYLQSRAKACHGPPSLTENSVLPFFLVQTGARTPISGVLGQNRFKYLMRAQVDDCRLAAGRFLGGNRRVLGLDTAQRNAEMLQQREAVLAAQIARRGQVG